MEKIIRVFNHLKNKWGIRKNRDVVLILVVFALAGSTVLKVADLIYNGLGYNDETHGFIKFFTYFILVLPIYQVLLLMYAFLLGQFYFFWAKFKKILKWFGRFAPNARGNNER